MTNFDKIDLQRFAVSALGAVTLSIASMLAAAGPVKAATTETPITVADWQNVMEQRIASFRERGRILQPSQLRSSDVTVRFTSDGDYAGAAIARSSGDRNVDDRALNVARNLKYTALPAGMRGAPANVRMTLYFGAGADAAAEYDLLQDRRHQNVRLAQAGAGVQTAAR